MIIFSNEINIKKPIQRNMYCIDESMYISSYISLAKKKKIVVILIGQRLDADRAEASFSRSVNN